MVRDQALALSGLLEPRGGRAVASTRRSPRASGRRRSTASGPGRPARATDRYRRGLYTFWRRTDPYPSMATFDAPSRETLHGPAGPDQHAAAGARDAQRPGLRRGRPGPGPADRRGGRGRRPRTGSASASGSAWAGPPRPRQVEVAARRSSDASTTSTAASPTRPRAMATDPLGPLPPGMDPAELAAWTAVANVLLNLDGVLTKGLISWTCTSQAWQRAQTRRQFLKDSQAGPGGASPCSALARPRRERRLAADAVGQSARPPRPPHFAPKAKRVIYLHMSGGAAAARPVRLQARAGQAPHAALPRLVAQGPAVRLHQGASQAARHPVQVRAARPVGAWISELAAPPRRASPTTWPSSGRCGPTSSTTPRPSCSCTPARRGRRGRDGLVGHLRPRLREREPAGLRRPDQRRHRPDRRQGPLEQRLPAVRLPGRAVPHGRRPDPVRQRPAGHGPRHPPPQPRRPAAAQRATSSSSSATRRR